MVECLVVRGPCRVSAHVLVRVLGEEARRRLLERRARDGDAERRVRDLGRKRVIQRRFNLAVPRARVPETTFMLRDRSER